MSDGSTGEGGRLHKYLERLIRAFGTQVREIETRVKDGSGLTEDTKVLSGLAKTLETLLALQSKVVKPRVKGVDLEALRATLAKRIAALDTSDEARAKA